MFVLLLERVQEKRDIGLPFRRLLPDRPCRCAVDIKRPFNNMGKYFRAPCMSERRGGRNVMIPCFC